MNGRWQKEKRPYGHYCKISGKYKANEKLEKLNWEIAKTEAKLRRAEHKEKMLEYQIKTLNRMKRTHWLCTRGDMLESHFLPPGIRDR